VNDGALLFLQTMLAKMVPPEEGGSRVAIIFNGSPLSNGDCGSGDAAASVVTRNVADFDQCGVAVVNPWGVGVWRLWLPLMRSSES
jgi:hypothetical protein